MAEPSAGVVTAEILSKLLMLSDRHLRQLVADGWIAKNPDGKYTTVGGVQGYIRYLKDEARRGMATTAKSRTNDARAKEIELRIAVQERKLVNLDETLTLVDDIAGVLRAELEGLAAGVTRDRELRHRIEERIEGAFSRSAKRLKEHAAALRAGGTAVDDPDEDDAGSVGEAKPQLPRKRGRPRSS